MTQTQREPVEYAVVTTCGAPTFRGPCRRRVRGERCHDHRHLTPAVVLFMTGQTVRGAAVAADSSSREVEREIREALRVEFRRARG